uniref:Uncharacterized protein n=1 Tax=Globodera rostochiensis TaxID=31243 RepID=A0A914I0I7_GLORO
MAFPMLSELVTLHTKDLSKSVPGTPHTFCALIAALKAECDQFAEIVAGLMSTIHRISIQFTNERKFIAILKVASSFKLERLNPFEDAARKRNSDAVQGEVEIGWDIEKICPQVFVRNVRPRDKLLQADSAPTSTPAFTHCADSICCSASTEP